MANQQWREWTWIVIGNFEKASGCQFFKVSALARNSLKYCKMLLHCGIFQEIGFHHLIGHLQQLVT